MNSRLLAIAGLCCLATGLGGCEPAKEEPRNQSVAASDQVANEPPASPGKTANSAAVETGTPSCGDADRQIFSCASANGKQVSVCRIERPGIAGFAQYRFGETDSAPELVWPSGAKEDRLTLANAMYSGGGEAQLSFARGGISYVVYSRTVRTNFEPGEPNDPAFSAGVAVLRGSDLVSELACSGETSEAAIDITKAEPLTKRDDSAFRYHDGRDWNP